jgi:OPA family glycerol-3-phosphate transporter-like MFS transporter
MVHWFSTKERGLVVSVWNVAHNVGGGLVASFALFGVTLFGDWGAKFYFNAAIAGAVAGRRVLPHARHAAVTRPAAGRGIQERLPAALHAASERTLTYREIFVEHVLNNRYLWAIASRTRSSISCATAS